MTQEALAKKFPVNTWTIKSIEKGRRKPSPELALRISQLTGIPVVALRPDLAAFASPANPSKRETA